MKGGREWGGSREGVGGHSNLHSLELCAGLTSSLACGSACSSQCPNRDLTGVNKVRNNGRGCARTALNETRGVSSLLCCEVQHMHCCYNTSPLSNALNS